MGDKFLVTGATGFVGSNIVRELVHRSFSVSIIVRNKDLNWRLHDIADKLDVHECDLLDTSLQSIVAKIKPTIVFHLASYGASPKENNIESLIDINIKGMLNLIGALKGQSLKLFINTGSSSEYGIKDHAMKETDVLEPINDYGVCKSAMTLFCQKISHIEHVPIVTFRLFSPYGQFEARERFMPTVIVHMLKNSSFELSSPQFVRDFIHIDDVVDAYITATHAKIPFGTIVNIGSGKQSSLQDVVKIVRRLTQSTSHVGWNLQKTQTRQIEPKIWKASTGLAKHILHWNTQTSLEAGLTKTIQWLKNNQRLYE